MNEEGGEDPEGGGEDDGMLEVETGSADKRAGTVQPGPDGVGGPAFDGGLFHEDGGCHHRQDRRQDSEMDAADRSPETQRRRRDAGAQQDPGRGRTAEHGGIGGGCVGGGDAYEHDAEHGNSHNQAETVGHSSFPPGRRCSRTYRAAACGRAGVRDAEFDTRPRGAGPPDSGC